MTRGAVAIAAMIVALATGYLILSPAAAQAPASPLRVVLSIILLFGVAFLGASLALLLQGRPHDGP